MTAGEFLDHAHAGRGTTADEDQATRIGGFSRSAARREKPAEASNPDRLMVILRTTSYSYTRSTRALIWQVTS
jgi:hypothetical protein